ncbi:MAG TPA: Wzz/FepE/Etk N-terminal domain-containing protein, partial [Burkholderiales bacterium]|nr:Wzz/FepE/Etk N-terminal domain-containing protein [Burkholderiales bacterium]
MDLSQFLLALHARRKAFMLALVATIVAALAVALIMPKKYVGQATVIVDARDEQTIAPSRGGVSISERAAYVATQIELVQSGRVATQVARDLNLAENADLREMWQADTGGVGPIDVWIGNLLLEKLKVSNTVSNLITIEYSSKSPKAAAQVANGFAKAYLDLVLELRNQPVREASQWFEEQLAGMRSQVTQAQNKLTAFQKQKDILVADEHLDIESARLTELNTQMLTARSAFYEAQSKYKQASELVASGGSPDAMADVMASAAVAAVKLDLARAESLLQTASTDLGPNHPVYMKYA